jgi:hypothetical protein
VIDEDDFLPLGYNVPLPEMTLREADPIGYERALRAQGRVLDPAASFKFAEEWERPATRAEVRSFQYRQQISEMWDRVDRDLTREERLWLVERYISPATTNADLILQAYRFGYSRGRKGAPR